MGKYNKIVLNIPHSSTIIPINTWKGDIHSEIEKWTDYYTDVIFAPSQETKDYVTPIVFPISRFFCDAERLPDEIEPLNAVGNGIFYTSFNNCTRENNREIKQVAMKFYNAHRELLSSAIKDDNTLLIDCHSFPKELAPEIDICLGFNEDKSKLSDETIQQIKAFFEDYGYNVGINNPYSNSITPDAEYNYHSLMIEINKKHIDVQKKSKIVYLNKVINYLYKNILYGNFK